MTDKQPDALRLAVLLELAPEDGVEPQTTEDAAAELRRQHTRIAELEARIKTMAEEHADELMVAHLDGRMRGCSTEPSGEYPALPDLDGTLWCAIGRHRKADTPAESSAAAKAVDAVVHTLLRSYVDADRAMRAHVGVEQAKRQYYYKVDGCPAENSDSPDCICWHDEGTGPCATDGSTIVLWRDAADALVMRAAQPTGAQQPAPSAAAAVSDEDEALDLLATLFDAWESGTPCYEEPESSDGFLGHAFRLDDEVFHRCADLLNRRRGKQPAAAPQADSQPAPDEATAMSRTGDLAEAGRWPSDWVEAYRRGYSDRASSAPADSVLEDAARALIEAIEYTPLGVRAITAMNQLRAAIAARKQGGAT